MKRAVIVHGFKGKPNTNWKPWLKHELEVNGFRVDVPEMPDTDHPEVSAWVDTLSSTVGEIGTGDIFLIGHSLGCITILKYLETLHIEQKIKACIFVAGFTREFKEYGSGHDSFFAETLDWQRIREHCNTFIAIHSKDDSKVGVEELEGFSEELHAKTILVDNMGHFGSEDDVFEIPVVRDAILDLF